MYKQQSNLEIEYDQYTGPVPWWPDTKEALSVLLIICDEHQPVTVGIP